MGIYSKHKLFLFVYYTSVVNFSHQQQVDSTHCSILSSFRDHQKDRLCGHTVQLLTCYIEHLLSHACLWGVGAWRSTGLFSSVSQAVLKTKGHEQTHKNLFLTDSIKVIQQNVQDILRNKPFAHLIYNPVLTITQLFDHFYICHKRWYCVMRESCY